MSEDSSNETSSSEDSKDTIRVQEQARTRLHPRDTPMGEDPDTVRGDTTPKPQRLPNQPMTHYATMPQKINRIADLARLAEEIISGLRNTGKTDKMKESTKDQYEEVLTMNPKSQRPEITELARIAKIPPKNAH